MDMTDLNRAQPRAIAAVHLDTPAIPGQAGDHWRDVVGEMSAEMAGPLTAALDRIQVLADTGRIDRASLRSLRLEVEQAREISISGQQLTRLASGQLRQNHERVALSDQMKEVLTNYMDGLRKRGIHIHQVLRPAEVIVDASLLFTLMTSLLTWTAEHAVSQIDIRVDIKTWPMHARIVTQFAYRPADRHEHDEEVARLQSALDCMTWRLLQQTAWTMGLSIERQIKSSMAEVTIEFPRTINNQLEGMSAIELESGFAPTVSSKPLIGSQVLVVASRRDVRVQVRDAVRNMGLIVDFVNSVEEAREFCRGGLPHAIVIESILRGDRFNALRREAEAGAADVVFIEIIEEGNAFEISGFAGLSMARVGRDAIISSLPSALMFELARNI